MKPILAVAIITALASPHAVSAQDITVMTQDARQAAVQLAQRLSGELMKEMSAGGPDAAVKVCRSMVPAVAGDLSLTNGWKVTRVSLKPRNVMMGTADAWEQGVLADFDTRAGRGEDASKLEAVEIVLEPAGRYFRYMKALPVQPLCLTCHGAPGEIAPGVKSLLAERYPHDRAVGYSVGQVRGAITIKRPL